VKYADELKTTLETAGAETLLRVHGVNTDSGIAAKAATFEGVEDFTTPTDVRLSTALIESRVVKSKREIEVMRCVHRAGVCLVFCTHTCADLLCFCMCFGVIQRGGGGDVVVVVVVLPSDT